MGRFWEFITGPATNLVGAIGGVIDGLHTSDEEKLQAKQEILKIERNFHLGILQAEQKWAETQASVIKAEIASQSFLAANWRPILMLVFTYIIMHNYVIAPVFSVPLTEIPPDMWELIKLGVGGYVAGRTVEKVLPQTRWARD